MIKNVSVKLFNFSNGGCIGDQERVCQTLQLFPMEGVLVIKNVSVKLFSFFNGGYIVIKNVSVKLFSFFNGGYIGDQERVCQTLFSWSRTCLNGGCIGDQERVCQTLQFLLDQERGGCIGDQERVCKTLQFLQWSVYRWSRTCLSKSSASLMDGIFVIKNVCGKLFSVINGGYMVIKNVSVKLFNFFNGGIIDDQQRVCETIKFLQRREYWWSRTCLSNS